MYDYCYPPPLAPPLRATPCTVYTLTHSLTDSLPGRRGGSTDASRSQGGAYAVLRSGLRVRRARTIKKSRRECAARSRPGRCAPSEREVINHDAGLRMGRLHALTSHGTSGRTWESAASRPQTPLGRRRAPTTCTLQPPRGHADPGREAVRPARRGRRRAALISICEPANLVS
jgi:hypothetical protein